MSKRRAWAWAAPLVSAVVAPAIMSLQAARFGLARGPAEMACWAGLGFLAGCVLTLADWFESRSSAAPVQDDMTRFANAPPATAIDYRRLWALLLLALALVTVCVPVIGFAVASISVYRAGKADLPAFLAWLSALLFYVSFGVTVVAGIVVAIDLLG